MSPGLVMLERPRVMEFFAGIGGAARAFEGMADVVAAIDINQNAERVYRANFDHPYIVKSIESLSVSALTDWSADTWWLSAPCQPFTRRGQRRGSQDLRSAALKYLLRILVSHPPRHLLLENVPGFESSGMRNELVMVLKAGGFHITELEICPTVFGVPNRRVRYYLVASRDIHFEWSVTDVETRNLGEFLDQSAVEGSVLAPAILERYQAGMNVVPRDARATNCFTAAYGRSMTRSGSFLEEHGRVRRFTPAEIARLLGFQNDEFGSSFILPDSLSDQQLYKLLGNSISVTVVRMLARKFLGQLNGSRHVE